MEQQDYKYYAFISYNSRDQEWGKRVQRKLEHYRMPATLCSQHGWKRTPIKPVFFAPTDIQPGGLNQELQERLQSARNLIVICSPNSAKSEWVGKEIEYFHQLGRTKQIHFFIVDGIPHSGNPDTECFNPIVDTLGLPEILGANIHEKIFRWPWLNKERAYVQLVSKLLGVEFDAIWQRHKRLLIKKAIAWTAGILAVLATLLGVWLTNQPVNVEVRLNEASIHNAALPPLRDAVVTIALDNEVKTDTIHTLDGSTTFTNIPHRYLGKPVHITFACCNFVNLDTTLVLTRNVTLAIYRDTSVYGDVHFRVWNLTTETGVPHVRLAFANKEVITDDSGRVAVFVPLEFQQTAYPVTSSVPLETTTINMPCGEDDVLITK